MKAQNEVLIFKGAGRTLLTLFVCLSSNHLTLKKIICDIFCCVHSLELLINLIYLF